MLVRQRRQHARAMRPSASGALGRPNECRRVALRPREGRRISRSRSRSIAGASPSVAPSSNSPKRAPPQRLGMVARATPATPPRSNGGGRAKPGAPASAGRKARAAAAHVVAVLGDVWRRMEKKLSADRCGSRRAGEGPESIEISSSPRAHLVARPCWKWASRGAANALRIARKWVHPSCARMMSRGGRRGSGMSSLKRTSFGSRPFPGRLRPRCRRVGSTPDPNSVRHRTPPVRRFGNGGRDARRVPAGAFASAAPPPVSHAPGGGAAGDCALAGRRGGSESSRRRFCFSSEPLVAECARGTPRTSCSRPSSFRMSRELIAGDSTAPRHRP